MPTIRRVLLGLSLAIIAAQCGDGDDAPTPTPAATETQAAATATPTEPATSRPSLAPTATATLKPLPRFHGPATRSGVPEIDSIIDLVMTGDAGELAARVRTTEITCEAEPMGVGSLPRCRDHEVPGEPLQALPIVQCEGVYVRESEVPELMREILTPELRLFAVYRAVNEDRVNGSDIPAFGIVFGIAPGDLRTPTFLIDGEGRIVAMRAGCVYPVNAIPAGRSFVVPPMTSGASK